MEYGGSVGGYIGQWLTHNYKFISYVIFLDETDSYIDEVDEWKEITDETEINAHTKGVGRSYGQLCIDVLNKINSNDSLPQKADN
jgi:hypothetical protein